MASQKEIERTYNYMDEALRRTLGECPDLSGAYYNGDFSLSLEEAQAAKHRYVLESLRFQPGTRVLDIGCGWGPILRAVREAGGESVGLTLSPEQQAACARNGLTAHLRDWKDVTIDDFGAFDGVVSIGAFEHFCSLEEYLEGRQDAIYSNFFALCHELLPASGRLYLQTMVWDRPVPPEKISLRAPKNSDEYVCALLQKFYPGSWLPYGKGQIVKAAEGFNLLSCNSGRRDYIQTMKVWRARKVWRYALRPRVLVPLTIRYLQSSDFRLQLESLRQSANRLCFEREIMDHHRMVFEKL